MTKKVILFAGIIVLAVVAIILADVYPIFFMRPLDTGVVPDTDISVIRNGVANAYCIKSSEGYILIDAGADSEAFKKTLQEKNISITDVRHIFLTHSDNDHVGAIGLFPYANVYMSEDELPMINGEMTRNGNIIGRIFSGNKNALPDGVTPESLILLTDGQELTIGDRTIRCVKAPGHTPGSMVFILDDAYLFTGDSFKVHNMQLATSPFTMDEKASKESIQNMYEDLRDTKLVLTAHYGYYHSADIANIF